MSNILGIYINSSNSGDERVDRIIDNYLSPRLERFRQLWVRREQVTPGNNPRETTWKPILENADFEGEYNALKIGEYTEAGSLNVTDYDYGKFEWLGPLGEELERGDTLYISYRFDYFPVIVLEALIKTALDVINAAEPATSLTLSTAPIQWDGAIAEVAYQYALEKLILDNLLWEPRLIFANPEEVISGLQTALDLSRGKLEIILAGLKKAPYVSPPTRAYYDAITMQGRASQHGGTLGYGRTRGIRINRFFGR